MANLIHVVRNRIQSRATWSRWGTGLGLLAGVALAAWVVAPVAWVLAIPALMVARRTGRIAHSGAEGEAATLALLKQLPDDHVVFNQLKIPCPGSKTGWVEADFVVVSPTRVTVIETKNHRGFIEAVGNQRQWAVQGLGGRVTTMANPCAQVRRHAALLGTWLRHPGGGGERAGGVKAWVETAVYFAHPRSGFTHDTMPGGVALLAHGQLLGHLNTPLPNDRPQDVGRVIEALVALRSWVPGQPLPAVAAEAKVTASDQLLPNARPRPAAAKVTRRRPFQEPESLPLHPLITACRNNPQAVSDLLAHGASPNGEGGGTRPLIEALLHRPPVVDVLLAAGASPSLENNRGETPLGCALSGQRRWRSPAEVEAMVLKLLAAGADPNAPSRGIPVPLTYVCWNQPSLVLPLLQAGADDTPLVTLLVDPGLPPETRHAWETWKAQKHAAALGRAIGAGQDQPFRKPMRL